MRCKGLVGLLLLVAAPVCVAHAEEAAITPRGHDAWEAFGEFRRHDGPRVLMLGGRRALSVPEEMLFKQVGGRELVEAVAAEQGLKTTWVQDGRYAILYAGAPDERIERAKKDLASADAAVRREAAGRVGWLRDVRIVPLLVKTAKDADAEVARQAVVSLRRMKWDVILALDATGSNLVDAELASVNAGVRREAMEALWRLGAEKGLASLERMLASRDPNKCSGAAWVLGSIGGEKAVALLEKALASQDYASRWGAAGALGRVGDERSLPHLEKTLSDKDPNLRYVAAQAIGPAGGEKALDLIKKMLSSNDNLIRAGAACALGSVGGEKAFTLIEKALEDKDTSVREGATYALGCVGGEKALALLEKALGDQYERVRCKAAGALVHIGSRKALALLLNHMKAGPYGRHYTFVSSASFGCVDTDEAAELFKMAFARERAENDKRTPADLPPFPVTLNVSGKKSLEIIEWALASPDAEVRLGAAIALGRVGGEKALALIEKALASKDAVLRSGAAMALGDVDGEKALPLLDRAIADPDANVRCWAAFALGSVGGERAAILLEKAFGDPVVSVRSNAVSALGRVGGEKALAVIEKALADKDPGMRYQASAALGSMGGEKSFVVIEKALKNPDKTATWHDTASVGAGEEAIPFLEKILAHPRSEIRYQAVILLGRIDGDKPLSLLEKALSDQDASVRRQAAYALGRPGSEKALALVEKALASQDAYVRAGAVLSLWQVERDQGREMLLQWLAEEKDENALRTVLADLRRWYSGDPTVEKALNEAEERFIGRPSEKKNR